MRGVESGLGPAGWRHSPRVVSGLPGVGSHCSPTGAKWYGPEGRGPGHVTQLRPPFCSAVLVFRAQRLTGQVAFALLCARSSACSSYLAAAR